MKVLYCTNPLSRPSLIPITASTVHTTRPPMTADRCFQTFPSVISFNLSSSLLHTHCLLSPSRSTASQLAFSSHAPWSTTKLTPSPRGRHYIQRIQHLVSSRTVHTTRWHPLRYRSSRSLRRPWEPTSTLQSPSGSPFSSFQILSSCPRRPLPI